MSTVRPDIFESIPKRRKVRTYYGDITLPSEEVLTELTDVRTEEETHRLITDLSVIYKGGRLNKYQKVINAIAVELSIRDPTLLARRAELVAKAREANMRGGQYKFLRGYSQSKVAPEEMSAQAHAGANFSIANKHREGRLQEIQVLENTISNCTFEKDGLLERLKHATGLDNKAAIGSVRSRLDQLEEQIYTSRKQLIKLNRSQKRSEQYYSGKLTKFHSERVDSSESPSSPPPPPPTRNDPELPGTSNLDSQLNSPSKGLIQITSIPTPQKRVKIPVTPSLDDLVTYPDQSSMPAVYCTVSSGGEDVHDYSNHGEHMGQDILTDVFTNTITSDLNGGEGDFHLPITIDSMRQEK